MCRRNMMTPSLEGVERRLSLSGLGALTPSVAVADESVQAIELENTLVSNLSISRPRPGGEQQIIAILIG